MNLKILVLLWPIAVGVVAGFANAVRPSRYVGLGVATAFVSALPFLRSPSAFKPQDLAVWILVCVLPTAVAFAVARIIQSGRPLAVVVAAVAYGLAVLIGISIAEGTGILVS